MILVRGKGTADMAKNLCRSSSQRLKMLLHIGEQHLKSAAVMIMRHDSSRDALYDFLTSGLGCLPHPGSWQADSRSQSIP